MLTKEDLFSAKNRKDILRLAEERKIKMGSHIRNLKYEIELYKIQSQLVELQHWIEVNNKRVAIIFEGRDASGKGGTIKRFTEHLNPRKARVVALNKPTETERGQWYFRRYIKELPNRGEIVFFDRSWYNRAVVEPVMGFCTSEQYDGFMQQVLPFEHMLYESGVKLIKFWFSVSKEEQKKRFESRKKNPLKRWKLSPVDQKAQTMWDLYTFYKEQMFSQTHINFSPWIIVKANNKKVARLESIKYILDNFDYYGKLKGVNFMLHDPNIVNRYYRQLTQIDI